jgi:hypothetical protein
LKKPITAVESRERGGVQVPDNGSAVVGEAKSTLVEVNVEDTYNKLVPRFRSEIRQKARQSLDRP